MKTIKSKIFSVYLLIIMALVITIMSAYVAVDTQRQHLIITELLSKQKLLIERVMFSTINIGEISIVDAEHFEEKLQENRAAISKYEKDVDFMLNAFTILEYPLNGQVVKLKFDGEFLTEFSSAVDASKGNWQLAKEELKWLLAPENLQNSTLYIEKLEAFKTLKTELIINSDYLTEICREEADRKKVLSESIQTLATALSAFIFLGLVYFINRDFKRPLEQIQEVFTKMGQGDFSQKLSRKHQDEFKDVFDDFNRFVESLSAIRRIENEVLKEDDVTKILNYMRHAFMAYVVIDEIRITYQNANHQIVEIINNEKGNLELELTNLSFHETMFQENKETVIMPIHINEAYLGYATFVCRRGFEEKGLKFMDFLGDKIAFAFYKSLLLKDLLSIVTEGLADLTESRDPETRQHLVRMSSYAQIIARQLYRKKSFAEEIDDAFINNIRVTAPMHDIGKISVPDSILLKPGKLTDEEFKIMKTHASEGGDVLNRIHLRFERYNLSYFSMAANIANYHQEKYNGRGYPAGISGTDIPLSARISAIADVFDALTSKRPYKEAFSLEKSYSIIKESSGSHFDPIIVDAFFEAQTEIEEVYNRYKEI